MSAIQFAPIRPVIKPVWKNKREQSSRPAGKPVCIIRTIEYSDGTKVTKTTTKESTVTRTLITPKIKEIIKEEKEKTPIVRLCSVCEKQGHNKRTCQVTEMFGNLYI